MRYFLIILIFFFSTSLQAQYFNHPGFGYAPMGISRLADANGMISEKKWSFNTYAEISTGMSFSKYGNTSYFGVPIGMQLNRKLSNNLYAFAGVSIAPVYSNFSHSFQTVEASKLSPYNRYLPANGLGMYSRAELGLMYVSDDKTFSISGSIGVEHRNYPPLQYRPVNTTARPVPSPKN